MKPLDTTGELPAVAEVIRVVDVTPRMRRVTFGGPGAALYASDPTRVPNIKISLPDPETGELDLPYFDHEGVVFRSPRQRELVRTYTVRRMDPDAGEFDIDFVRHGDGGLASAWAERARPGSTLGALGGGGVVAAESDWYLLVGDETALPAIGRMVEALPASARGRAIVEIADDGERQELHTDSALEITWLSRNGAPAGSTDLLKDAVAAVDVPTEGDPRVFAWVGAEARVAVWMRRHLRETKGLDRKQTLVIGYWRRGDDETTYGRTADHDRVDDEYDVELYDELQDDDHDHDHDH